MNSLLLSKIVLTSLVGLLVALGLGITSLTCDYPKLQRLAVGLTIFSVASLLVATLVAIWTTS